MYDQSDIDPPPDTRLIRVVSEDGTSPDVDVVLFDQEGKVVDDSDRVGPAHVRIYRRYSARVKDAAAWLLLAHPAVVDTPDGPLQWSVSTHLRLQGWVNRGWDMVDGRHLGATVNELQWLTWRLGALRPDHVPAFLRFLGSGDHWSDDSSNVGHVTRTMLGYADRFPDLRWKVER